MDMIWQGYQRQRVRKRESEYIFHELESSSAKVLDMMFQFQRRKGAWRAREANTWVYENKLAKSYATALILICPHLWSHIQVVFDRPLPLPLGYLFGVGKTANVILSSFYLHWCLNIWWAMALLQLRILNKSEGWISLRVTFSISFTISPQIGEAINSLHF